MITIVDSGSTKTVWHFIQSDKCRTVLNTLGMNPNFLAEKDWESIVATIKELGVNAEACTKVFFYGAGCGTDEAKSFIAKCLKTVFKSAELFIDTDLLGACRSSNGKSETIVGIMGTGSSSCVYDGEKIVERLPALGYTLGDEGSGNHIGKKLIKAYLQNKMPSDLHSRFKECYPCGVSYFLENLYSKPYPNRFLASFAPFAKDNIEHPFIVKLLDDVFTAFVEEQIMVYSCHKSCRVYLIGSVAYHFADVIRSVARRYGLNDIQVAASPMEGLQEFHASDIVRI
jgi:N-acetylglucosamine kinase-like BadF-type ATPase